MIKNINELAKFVKGGADVLQKAIESEDETSLEFIEGSFVSNEDLETLKTSVKNEGKKEGQTIGYDFAMKDLKGDFGLEIEGKDRKVIAEAIKTNILADANKKPDAKIQELNTSLENLRNTYTEEKSTWEQEKQKYSGEIKDVKITSELLRELPEVKGLNKKQFATLVKTEFDFDLDENQNLIAKKNGQPIKDNMEKPIPVSSILTDYATQNGWFSSNGRGGEHEQESGTGEFKSINDVYKHMETNNINPMSAAGEKLINEFKEN